MIQQRFQEEALPSEQVIEMVYRDPSKLDKYSDDEPHKLLLSSFLALKRPLNEVKQKIAVQRKIKEKQLYVMLDYIYTPHCKRELLLSYFQESLHEKPQSCCSSCGIHLEQYEDIKEESQKSHKKFGFDWENRLNDLFLLENL